MEPDIDNFIFRGIHPNLHIGTASDRYSGWIGQIYTEGKYSLSARAHKVGDKTYKEELMPIESVAEYFRHFSVLEIDFTFYKPLLNKDLRPTSNYKILQGYNKYIRENDWLILKVPQVVFARKMFRAGKQEDNPGYLNAEMFINQFYDPANAILGENLAGFVFEQEYLRKQDRIPVNKYIEELDEFFGSLPADTRYHIETRTDFYHVPSYFEMLQKHGVGYVLSHWTWLPPLRKQFLKAGKKFVNKGRNCVIRLLTPLRMNFNVSYEKAFPFDKMVPGMMNPEMIPEAVEIMRAGIKEGLQVNVIVNNRAGGNAPLLASELAGKFVSYRY